MGEFIPLRRKLNQNKRTVPWRSSPKLQTRAAIVGIVKLISRGFQRMVALGQRRPATHPLDHSMLLTHNLFPLIRAVGAQSFIEPIQKVLNRDSVSTSKAFRFVI